MRLQERLRLAYRREKLSIFVGDLNVECLLHRHDKLDQIKRISIEVLDQRSIWRHLAFIHAQLVHDDLLEPGIDLSDRDRAPGVFSSPE